jgi:hypothetical protein
VLAVRCFNVLPVFSSSIAASSISQCCVRAYFLLHEAYVCHLRAFLHLSCVILNRPFAFNNRRITRQIKPTAHRLKLLISWRRQQIMCYIVTVRFLYIIRIIFNTTEFS